MLIDEVSGAPLLPSVPDMPDGLPAAAVVEPPATAPTPIPLLPPEAAADDDFAPVAWGADPTEWDDAEPADEQPDDFRRY
jgi:hypothetical protein